MFVSKIASFTTSFKLNSSKPSITNLIFKLHYKVTVLILVALFVFVCSNEYFGDKIQCIADEGLPASVANTYCYFIGTFTIVRHYNEDLLVHGMLPHPGVGPRLKTDDVFIHHYYQWVPLVLILQAICFYAPYSVWKNKEGGRLQSIIDSLQLNKIFLPQQQQMSVAGTNIQSKSELQRRLRLINADLFFRLTLSRHWASWLMRMEVVNFFHVVLQIWITNIFLNGKFLGLGAMILSSSWNYISDPLEYVFPKVTKCEFHKYGPSGTVQKYDSLCVMALNIIHEKVYMVLWFWFLILLILSLLVIIWRLMQYCLYRRSFFVQSNTNFLWKHNMSRYMKLDPDSSLRNTLMVFMFLNYEDWLFLRYLSKNMNGFAFQELFKTLTNDIEHRLAKNNDDYYGINYNEEKEKPQLHDDDLEHVTITPEAPLKTPATQPVVPKDASAEEPFDLPSYTPKPVVQKPYNAFNNNKKPVKGIGTKLKFV